MKGKIFMGALASLSLFVMFSACDIGLGGAVDTEAPTGTLSSPDVDAIIRGSFGIKGTWQDDGTVSSVKISLKNTTTQSIAYYDATVESSGVWYCEINPNDSGQPLVDGSYLATIVISDNGGHSSSLTRSYTIDNTPPLMVITRPSTLAAASSFDSYGQTLTLEGQAVDDNDVSKILVNIYDASTNALRKTVTLSNVPPTMELDVAKFVMGNEENDYYQIYGSSTANGTKKYYCTFTAYDSAKYYPLSGENSSEGNSTQTYYLYNSISDLINSYKVTELHHMFTGSYSGDSSKVPAAKAFLNENAVSKGQFSLNPNNNPTYTVSGRSSIEVGSTISSNMISDYQFTNGSGKIIVEVSPGLDKIPIDPSTVGIYLLKCDASGNPTSTADEAKIWLYQKGSENSVLNTQKRVTVGTAYKYTSDTINRSDFELLDFESYYRVYVVGQDTSGNEICVENNDAGNSQIFIFYLISSQSVIELNITSTPSYISTIEQSSSQPGSSTVLSPSSENQTLTVNMNYNYTDSTTPLKVLRSFTAPSGALLSLSDMIGTTTSNQSTYTDTITRSTLLANSKPTKIYYQFVLTDGNTDSTISAYSYIKSVTVNYDNEIPVIDSVNYPSTSETANPSFTFRGTASDISSEVTAVYINITDETDTSKTTGDIVVSGTNDWSYTIYSSNLPSGGAFDTEGYKTVKIWAVDKVGLISDVTTKTNWIYDTSAPVFTITDYIPRINDAYSDSNKFELSTTATLPSFNIGKGFMLEGTATDNFGIQSITIKQHANDGSADVTLTSSTDSSGTGMIYDGSSGWYIKDLPRNPSDPTQLKLPDVGNEVIYTYTFSITDKSGEKSTAKTLTVTIDRKSPKLEITSPGTDAFGEKSLSGTQYDFKADVSDAGLGMAKVLYKITESEATPSDWESETVTSNGTWILSKSLGTGSSGSVSGAIYEGKKYLHVKAVDKADNETEKFVKFCVDQAKPDIIIKVYKKSDNSEISLTSLTYLTQESFYIIVTASDANGIYTGYPTAVSNISATGTINLRDNNDGTWTSDEIKDLGTHTLTVTAYDGSGDNAAGKKATKEITVLYDNTPPVFNIENGDDSSSAATYWIKGTGSTTLTGTVTDAESGISTATVQIDDIAAEPVTLDSTGNWTYSFNPSLLEENTKDAGSYHTITFTARNKAGLSNTGSKYFRYDKYIPTVTVTADNEFVGASSNNSSKNTLKLNGQVYDTLATSRPVETAILTASATSPTGTVIDLSSKTAGSVMKQLSDGISLTWNTTPTFGAYSYPIDSSNLDEGTYTFKVSVTDYAGQTNTAEVNNIIVDKTAPSVSPEKLQNVVFASVPSHWFNSTTLKFEATASDNANGCGLDTVEYSTTKADDSWISLTKSGTKWSGTIIEGFSAGTANKLYIRATDKAGNIAYYNETGTIVQIDTTAPNLESLYYKVGSGNLSTSGGTTYVNGSKAITVYGLYKDDESGVGSKLVFKLGNTEISPTVTYSTTAVTYEADGTTPKTDWITTAETATNDTTKTDEQKKQSGAFLSFENFSSNEIKTWKAVYTPTANGKFTVSGTNGAGTSSGDISISTISFDTTAPDVKNISLTTSSNTYKVYQPNSNEYTYWVNNTNTTSAPQTFTLSGIATDNVGVDTVTLTVGGTPYNMDPSSTVSQWSFSGINLGSLTTSTTAILTVTDKAGNMTKDSEGNSSPITLTIKFDSIVPGSLHILDDSDINKDIFFRIGKQDNDDITSSDPIWNNNLDKDVGGKYSSGTFGNSTSMKIRGYFNDSESGVSKIYYRIYPGSTPTVSGDDLKNEVLREPTGSITPLTINQERRVFYTGSKGLAGEVQHSSGKYYATVESSFVDTISGFKAGSNYLVLVAVDNVGNSYLDTVTIGSTTYENASINVDMEVPKFTSAFSNKTIFSNGTTINGSEASMTLTGTVTDVGATPTSIAGVKSMVLTVGTGGPTITATLDEKESVSTNWSAVLPASLFSSASGNVTVYGIATDCAGDGNSSSSISVATICVDRTEPTVTINSPTDADTSAEGIQVNGTISLSGTISNEDYLTDDSTGSGTMVLYYTTSSVTGASAPTKNTVLTGTGSASSDWIRFETPAKHNNSWTFSGINTRQLPDSCSYDDTTKTYSYGTTHIADGNTVYFTVAATDKAGNIGYANPISVKIDQDTDRPEITFSNLTLKGTDDSTTEVMGSTNKVWTKTSTLYGTIKDDDGIRAVYIASTDGTVPTDWGDSIYTNGAWEYTASEGYGVLWFKVVDTENGETNPFISSISSSLTTNTNSNATLLYTPKLRDKKTDDNEKINCYGYKSVNTATEISQGLKTAVYVQVDTKDPEIYQTTWFTQDLTVVNKLKTASATELKAIMDNPAGYNWNPLSKLSGVYIGGPDSKIYIMYKSIDKNGIKQTAESFGDIQGTKIVYVGSSKASGTDEITYSLHEVTDESPLNAPYSTNDLYFTQVVSFNLSGITSSNSVKMTLAVTDRANRTYERNSYFAVDNDAPTVEFRNKSDGDSVYGSLSVSVTGRTTETRSTISKLYFGVTNDADNAPTAWNASDATELDLTKWIDFTDYVNTASWSLTFDGESNTNASESTTYHASTLNTYMDTLYGSGTTTTYDSKPLYIWVYAVDSLGNTGNASEVKPERLKLDVLTQGDKPSVSITYPASDVTIGGTIRLAGTTEINTDSVEVVWLQIDPSYDESAGFNENWATELKKLITKEDGSLKDVGYSIVEVAESETAIPASASTPGSTLKAGILATGSVSSWNLPINILGEFTQIEDGTDADGNTIYKNRVVAVRACAVSKTNHKLSNYDNLVYFTVDPDSPQFGGYDGAENYLLVSADGTKTQKYTSGMWVSGLWYLKGSIIHSADIKTLSKVISKTESSSLVIDGNAIDSFTDGTEITSYTKTVGEQIYKGFNFKIPVGSSATDAVGKTSFTLNAVDNSESHNTANLSVSINYDNKAPSSFMAKTTTSLSATGNTFKQSNKTFTLSGTVVEGGTESGFARNAFYFTRDITENGTTTRYFIDPMTAKGDTKKANFVKLGILSDNGTFTAESGIEYNSKDGLYWRISSGASIANTNQLTVTSLPENVRVGGLCKIKNVIYRIKSVSDTILTIDGEFESESGLTVYFALAQVIDNTVLESGTTKLYEDPWESLSNDDGDYMVEGITQNGTTYSWTGSINSKNIYDGPVTLHFSYSDVAGNIATASYGGKVANNAPRLAGVTIATDYNGDGSYNESAGELKSYWVGSSKTTSANVATDVADEITVCAANNGAYMTVKDSTEIRAEIVGGNGNLYYSYNIGTTLGASGNIHGDVDSSVLISGNYDYDTTSDDSYMMNGEYIKSRTATIKIPVDYFTAYNGEDGAKIENSTATAPTWFQYVIWDETDGTIKFTDSQHATMNIALAVKVHDEENPTATINPFYWNSNSDNSLYGKSTSNGHIELTGDLPSTFTIGGSGVNDRDPKVSGKIVITGYASDNIRLGSLKVSISKSSVLSSATPVAVYNNGTWYDSSSASIPSGVIITQGRMEATEDLPATGWSFTVSSAASDGAYNNEEGHRVKWTLSYDTEKITDTADTDVVVTVQAVDKVSKTGDGTTQMDVVPYITGVTTSLSSLKSNNPSVYARTALGHYAVNSDETVTLSGFNLDATTLDISTLSASGEYNYSTSNNIPALNNLNDNDVKGSFTGTVDLSKNPTGIYSTYANYYNRQPNNDNNNLLTDDIYFDVWQITSDAVQPKAGAAVQPVMAINPYNHDVGFAFVNGTLYYSMPDGNTNSYNYWIGGIDFWTSVGLAYDKYGNSYGTAAGGDINSNKADQFRIMTSRWGHAGLFYDAYNDGSNQFRLEMIGQRDFEKNGTSYTGYNNFDKERIQSPSIATTATSSDKTTVYLAYYDEINDEIRFKWGYFSDSKRGNSESGLMGDYYGLNNFNYGKGDGGNSESGDKILDSTYGIYRVVHNSFLAGQTERVVNTDGTKVSTKVVTTDGKPVYAGKYVSIAALEGKGTNDDAVVAVWWDGTNNQLLYSFNKTPKSITAGTYKQSDTKWSTPVAVFGSKIGQYCKVVTDAKGGVHIAGYDGSNGDIWYAYLDEFDQPSNMKTCIVDSYGIIGTRLNIDVALDTNLNPVPYISYYSATRPKIARWSGAIDLSSTTLKTGAIKDAFTGYWEVSYVPTSSSFSDSNIGVGVWKDSDGKLNYSTKDGNAPDSSNIGKNTFKAGTSVTSESYGTVWGNGTKNPILGYAITSGASGYIETAQMK